jgi:glycosyltransferase involved in cell wall biosynthesis
MKTLTACIVAKNEECIIEKSLTSIIQVVDEIVFVDTGSTDKTLEIAKMFTSRIFHNRHTYLYL